MSRERDIFLEALEAPAGAEREALLERLCGGDGELLRKVTSLLEAHEAAGRGFLEQGKSTPGIALAEGPGALVGRYRLLEKIGEGGFGDVYLAEQRSPVRRRVALKIIKLGMDTRQVVARFEAERQALALMEHPNIARVLDGGATEGGRPYFVMEWVRGTPITRFCDERNASLSERLELFVPVCEAIHHAHQKGIVHRDIKPSNVLVSVNDDRPAPKVIDFGVAKAVQHDLTDKTVHTRAHELVGTPAYMSPEQARGDGLDVDTRADIYSLGVLLYELLTGYTPFDAGALAQASFEELRRIIVEVEPDRPSARVQGLPPDDRARVARCRDVDPARFARQLKGDLDWIVLKALEKDRALRYESAAALAQDIQRHLRNEPVLAVAPSFSYRLEKFRRRHRAALPAAAAACALLLATTFTSAWLAVRASNAEEAMRALLETEQTARRQLEQIMIQLQNARRNEALMRERADEEAARARAEAATSEAVTRFLNDDVFGVADPENEPDRQVTLRTVLDRAARQLPGVLAQQPRVEAEVNGTIGRAYMNLGEFVAAERHLRRAVELFRAELGRSDPKTIEAMLDLNIVLERSGQTLPALPVAKEAWELARENFGTNHPLSLQSLSRVAWSHYRLGQQDEANAAAAAVWEAAQGLPDPLKQNIHAAAYIVARSMGTSGRFEEGEELLRELLRVTEEQRGPAHAKTIRARNNLAVYYYDHRRNLDAAERLYLDALAAQTRLLGEDHAFTRVLRGNLALLYEVTGRPFEQWEQLSRLMEWSPTPRVVDRVNRLTHLGVLVPAGEIANEGEWRFSRQAPDPGWTTTGFNDAAWTLEPSTGDPGGELWARCEFHAPDDADRFWVFRVPHPGEFRVFLNGVEAASRFGAVSGGFQLAVCSRTARESLAAGRNVLAFWGKNWSSDARPRLEVFETASGSRDDAE